MYCEIRPGIIPVEYRYCVRIVLLPRTLLVIQYHRARIDLNCSSSSELAPEPALVMGSRDPGSPAARSDATSAEKPVPPAVQAPKSEIASASLSRAEPDVKTAEDSSPDLFGFTLARANARMLINAEAKRSSARNPARTSRPQCAPAVAVLG